MKSKQFLVIGAGRFGTSLARTLFNLGNDVLIVDRDEEKVQHISTEVTDAVKADTTLEESLKALDVKDFDAVVIAIGEDIQASIMTAILLVELKAAYIVAKAQTALHGRVLEKIGVNHVVFPEQDMGQKIAHSLIAPTIIDMIELSEDYSVVEITAPAEMVGKTLKELNLRARFEISIIALRRNKGDNTVISPRADDVIEDSDILVAIGENKALEKLEWI